jgi:membrane protease YdiL (CAAX protease family)
MSTGPSPRGSLWLFFAGSFAAAWALWIPVAVGIHAANALGWVLVTIGALTPAMVALALTAHDQGGAGVRALVAPVTQGRVAARWYLFALGYTVAVKLGVALLHRVLTGGWPRFGDLSWLLIPFAIAISTPVQSGEEIGWRGYALPRLAARIGLARASLVLGVIWAAWHLPLFFVRWNDTWRQSFVVFTLQVTAISVAFAWLWERTGHSLLLPMLLHAAVNNTKDIVPSATPGGAGTFGLHASLVAWLTVALFWACALVMLVWMARGAPAAQPAAPG